MIAAEVASAEPGTPIILVGHSLGGFVATTWAQRNPDALAGLVLVGAMADPRRHPLLTRLYTDFARLLPLVGPERMVVAANAVLRDRGAPRRQGRFTPGSAVWPVPRRRGRGKVPGAAGCS